MYVLLLPRLCLHRGTLVLLSSAAEWEICLDSSVMKNDTVQGEDSTVCWRCVISPCGLNSSFKKKKNSRLFPFPWQLRSIHHRSCSSKSFLDFWKWVWFLVVVMWAKPQGGRASIESIDTVGFVNTTVFTVSVYWDHTVVRVDSPASLKFYADVTRTGVILTALERFLWEKK